MPETVQAILPALTFLASIGGAGWLAGVLLEAARRRVPRPVAATWQAAPRWRQALYAALYAPAHTRIVVFALAGLIAVGASVARAALLGAPVAPAFDATLAIVVSQLLHTLQLPADVQTRS